MKKLGWGLLMLCVFGAPSLAHSQDHFRSRQQAAPNSFWEGNVELRPWGGPTTGRNWWTPMPRSTGQSPAVRVVFIPGHFEWHYGRRIWVPGRYVVVPAYTSSAWTNGQLR